MSGRTFKKAAAAVCSFCLAAAMLTSCGDTTYICKSGDKSINAGVFIYYVMSQINNQTYSYYQSNGKMSEDIINEKYGDGTMTVGDFAHEDAYSSCERLMCTMLKFDELGLSFTDDEKQEIKDTVEANWDPDYYESIGIAKSSLEQIQTGLEMYEKIFYAYYGEGGTNAVSDSDINTFIKDNYVRFKLISIVKTEGKESEAEATAEEYAKMAEEKSFDEVIKEYNEKTAEENGTASDTEDEEETDNNIMVNKNSSSYSDNEVVKYISTGMNNGEIKTYEDDNYWYVIEKLDVTDYPEYVKDNRDSLLQEMKTDEFEEMIDGWQSDAQIEQNTDAFSRYSAEKVYDKYLDYQEDQANK